MPISYRSQGISGEILQATFAHDFNDEKKTITMESANWDLYFDKAFQMAITKPHTSIAENALKNLASKDYDSNNFLYTIEECLSDLELNLNLLKPSGMITIKEIHMQALLDFENELVDIAFMSDDENIIETVKSVTTNLSINGHLASETLKKTRAQFSTNITDLQAHFGSKHPYHRDFDLE